MENMKIKFAFLNDKVYFSPLTDNCLLGRGVYSTKGEEAQVVAILWSEEKQMQLYKLRMKGGFITVPSKEFYKNWYFTIPGYCLISYEEHWNVPIEELKLTVIGNETCYWRKCKQLKITYQWE